MAFGAKLAATAIMGIPVAGLTVFLFKLGKPIEPLAMERGRFIAFSGRDVTVFAAVPAMLAADGKSRAAMIEGFAFLKSARRVTLIARRAVEFRVEHIFMLILVTVKAKAIACPRKDVLMSLTRWFGG